MSVWVIFLPIFTYAGLVLACARFPAMGRCSMLWFNSWLMGSLAWIALAGTMEW